MVYFTDIYNNKEYFALYLKIFSIKINKIKMIEKRRYILIYIQYSLVIQVFQIKFAQYNRYRNL